jgi:hypothetical protein
VTTVWYCTREAVKSALDSAETARNNAAVDRAIAATTDQIYGLTHRSFYPLFATRYFDGPAVQLSDPIRLWLDRHDLVSATTVVVDGVTLSASDYLLRPDDGPPYNRVEIDVDSSASWVSEQRGIAITGTWGWEDSAPAGALAGAMASTTTTSVTVTNSAAVGIGDLIRVDTERMTVTGRAMADTGVDIHASDSLTASAADVGITLSTATGAPQVGETILVDSERMLVVDLAGTMATVKRAWDGSVLSVHAAGASIWAPRTLTVERGALGTAAATHLDAAAVTRHVPPPLITALAIAEAVNTLLNEGSGYARVAGQGDNAREYWGRSLAGLRDQAYRRHGRKARIGAI